MVLLCLASFCAFASGFGQRQLSPPAQPNPLLDVVGQRRPQNLQPHFHQSAQPKLFQPQFVFDPRIGKFRHRSALSIDRSWPLRFASSQRTAAPPVNGQPGSPSDHDAGYPDSTPSETDKPHIPPPWRHICETPPPDKIPAPWPLSSLPPDSGKYLAGRHS